MAVKFPCVLTQSQCCIPTTSQLMQMQLLLSLLLTLVDQRHQGRENKRGRNNNVGSGRHINSSTSITNRSMCPTHFSTTIRDYYLSILAECRPSATVRLLLIAHALPDLLNNTSINELLLLLLLRYQHYSLPPHPRVYPHLRLPLQSPPANDRQVFNFKFHVSRAQASRTTRKKQ